MKVISGRAKAGEQQSADYAELMESGLVASEPGLIYHDVPRGKWSTGIFDCMRHIPSCLTGCFCSCIIYGQVMTVSPEQAGRVAIIRFHYFAYVLGGYST